MSEAKTLEFELVGPESRVVDGPMWQVVMPGTLGDFGVRAGHCALVASLGPGVVSFWRSEDDQPRKIFVDGGFAHVTGDSCTVLAEETVEISRLDRGSIENELKSIESEMVSAVDDAAQRDFLTQRALIARAKLEALKHSRSGEH